VFPPADQFRSTLSFGWCGSEQVTGTLPPPGAFSSTDPILRVAVGIDFRLKNGWAFRYIFSETIQPNPISRQLTPPADRRLANFQNLFGLVKQF
jgi:hypothetical protein